MNKIIKSIILMGGILALFSCNNQIKKQSLIDEKEKKVVAKQDTIKQFKRLRFYELKGIDPKAVHIVKIYGQKELNGFLELCPTFPYLEELSLNVEMTEDVFDTLMDKLKDKLYFKELTIDRCSLKKIPSTIAKLQHLEVFTSFRNPLTEISPEIGLMKNLRKLSLDPVIGNELKVIPSEIGQLENLETFILSRSKVEILPAEIGNCKNLLQITINNSQLKSLPPEIGLCSQLRSLTLAFNEIESLPPEIGSLAELRGLSLAINELSELPISIKNLKKLVSLDLTGNKFSVFPKEILSLNQLSGLSIDQNEFKIFPVEIGDLINLKHLRVDRNLMDKHTIEVLKTKNRGVSINLIDRINK